MLLHVTAAALTLVWTAANFYLWSFKQDPALLLWQSLGMLAIALSAFYWYADQSGE
jgi:hypothetical protein